MNIQVGSGTFLHNCLPVHTVVIRLSPHFFKSASRISPHSVGLKMRINIYGSVYCDRVNPK
jgi:hypothetical protein